MIKNIGLNVEHLCDAANVSKSGYYKWNINSDKPEKDYEDYLIIKKIFDSGKGKYGWRSVKMRLAVDMNHKKIIRIKNKYHLFTQIRKRNPYKDIMKKTKEHRTFGNLLDRKFVQDEPRKVFCTDITYLPYNQNLAYFSAIKDIASGEIVGWKTSKHIRMDIVLETLDSLKNNVESLKDIVIHSDQGAHYTSPQYINQIEELKMIQSMSRKGNCIDNSPMESFLGHLKDDVDYENCKTFEELTLLMDEYVEYYNNERPQWELKKMTPVQYRDHLLSQK